MRAPNFKGIQIAFVIYVWEIRKSHFVACWAGLLVSFDSFDTRVAENITTACDLVGVTNYL